MSNRLTTPGAALGLVIACAVAAGAGQERPAAPDAAPQGATPPAGGMGEGIKVHGHWTIDLRNPDGTLAGHHEFENALAESGALALSLLLGRGITNVRDWLIVIQPESDVCGVGVWCVITEWRGSGPPPLGTLSASVNTTFNLAGTFRATNSGLLRLVATQMNACQEVSCSSGIAGYSFTIHTLAAPIPVAANQLVEVKVVISFS